MKNTLVKNMSYSLLANLFSMIVSVLSVLVLPKILSGEGYGYYQLYIFYSGYVGYLQLGWIDGIYLRYGGQYFDKLEKDKFCSQIKLFTIFTLLLSFLIVVLSFSFVKSYSLICIMIAIYTLLYLPRTLLQTILQTTNQIREYAKITLFGRTIFGILILILALLKCNNYIYYVLSDIIGRLVALILSMIYCSSLIFTKQEKISKAIKEAKDNMHVGINLMLSNLASLLIIGIVRFFIQLKWDVVTFGKVSLTVSISNLLLIFITAISVTLFPMLKRAEKSKLMPYYNKIQTITITLILFCMIFYYPLSRILTYWISNYSESIKYVALLFPMCLYECKMNLLINTYLKTLRKEKQMLTINIIMIIISLIASMVVIFVFENLNLAILLIMILSMIRCIISEIYLSKVMEFSVWKEIISEALMSLVFILVNWIIGGWIGFIIYIVFFVCYVFAYKNNIKQYLTSYLKRK